MLSLWKLPKSPKTTKKRPTTKQKILRPKDSENDQFGRKRPKMATLLLVDHILSEVRPATKELSAVLSTPT